MNKLKWKKSGYGGCVSAKIGNMNLHCYIAVNPNGSHWYYAHMRPSNTNIHNRSGPSRKSMRKAKEDAVRLSREFLEDCRVAIDKEMKILSNLTGETCE